MPDRILLSRARRGDQDAVAELYRENVGAALKYARAISPSIADAEDLVAESFARVITQLSLDRGPDSSFRAYLFTTMRHRLYSTNRREYAVDDEAMLDRPYHDRPTEDTGDHGLLKQAFDTLSPQEQEVLLLLDVHELRPTEVCSRLGLRASALSMRANRARNALAEAYLVAHVQPGPSTECRTTRQLLGRHARGTLSTLRVRHVGAHLETCDSCAEAAAEVANVNRSLRAIPIFFGVPSAAAPHGWRALLRGLRGHVSAGPTVMKAAVVVAALAASAGAAVALASAPHPGARPASTHTVLADDGGMTFVKITPRLAASPSSSAAPTSPTRSAVSTSPSSVPTSRTPPDHHRASPMGSSPAVPMVPTVPDTPSVTVVPRSTYVAPTPSVTPSIAPSSDAPSSDDPTTDAPSSDAPTSDDPTSPSDTATPTATPTVTPTATPTPTPTSTDSHGPCDLLDLNCWWASLFG